MQELRVNGLPCTEKLNLANVKIEKSSHLFNFTLYKEDKAYLNEGRKN